jgi:pyrroline-5-carboxylate reductase
MQPSVALLGAGTLGGIVIAALIEAGWPPESIAAVEGRAERVVELRELHGIAASSAPDEVLPGRSVLVVAVKPKDVSWLLESIAPSVGPDRLVLSLVAGVPIATYEAALPGVPVVRVMPNTPAAVGMAMSAYAPGAHVNDEHLVIAHRILTSFGDAIRVEEQDLDAVTAVSGSGPAYVFLLAEAMQQAGVSLGLEPDVATRLVQQTIAGAGTLLASSPQTAEQLRVAVTSPGGTTAAALATFAEGGFTELVVDALRSAAARSVELGAG